MRERRQQSVRKMHKFLARQWTAVIALFIGVLTQIGCPLVAPSTVANGIGQKCESDMDCHASRCERITLAAGGSQGICTISCSLDAECGIGAACINQRCHVPLSVGVALTGTPTEIEGWTFAHKEGLEQAAKELGFVKLNMQFNLIPGNVLPEILALAEKNDLIIGNTVDYIPDFKKAAEMTPAKKFLCIDDGVLNANTDNFTAYWIYRLEAWYIAGRLAAGTKDVANAAKPRLGVISAFINPETVADVNAFTLGARSRRPDIVVEVRHMGFWFDLATEPTYSYKHLRGNEPNPIKYYREEYLAALMADSGCQVIAHIGNTQRSVRLIHRMSLDGRAAPSIRTYANDNRNGCSENKDSQYATCLGSIYENWYSLYRDVFQSLHVGTYQPLVSKYYHIDGTDTSPTGVAINPSSGIDSVAAQGIIAELLRKERDTKVPVRQLIMQGNYKINGQRDLNHDGIPDSDELQQVKEGEVITIAEAAKMCWYVDGVVEKVDREDPLSPDRPALVPGGLVPGATVPNTSVPYGSYPTDRLVVPSGLSGECRKNTF